jgi:lysozyme family protein
MTIPELIAANQGRWATCAITPSRVAEVTKVAQTLTKQTAKFVYEVISTKTKVPWWVIAVIHERECSQSFACSIAQGDPWNKVSTHVPRGIGPFQSFTDAAVYALTTCPPKTAAWTDWSAGGTLTILEEYNGLGYDDYHKEASPYIWGATNHEQWGKYIEDGRYSPTTWDTQLGCAAMLKAMMSLDPTITMK